MAKQQELALNEKQVSPLQNAIQNLKNKFSSYEKEILPQLLSAHGISPAMFVQVVMTEIKKSDKLLQAFMENPSSMLASVLAGAEIGLIPSDTSGEF